MPKQRQGSPPHSYCRYMGFPGPFTPTDLRNTALPAQRDPPPTQPTPRPLPATSARPQPVSACAVGMFARLLPAQGDTPSFRRLDEIAHGLAPSHDVSSGCLADSEVAALRPLRLCRVVAAGLSGSGKRGYGWRGGDRWVCSVIFFFLLVGCQSKSLHAYLLQILLSFPEHWLSFKNFDPVWFGNPLQCSCFSHFCPSLPFRSWKRPESWPCIIFGFPSLERAPSG